MAVYQRGKALLSVEKDGNDLYATINCLSGIAKDDWGGLDWLGRSTQELADFCGWLPPQCEKMENGDKCVFKVNFEQSFYKGDGYSSDDDEELVFYNVRKLQHSRGKDMSRNREKKLYFQPKSKLKYGGKIKQSKKQLLAMGYTESDMVYFT